MHIYVPTPEGTILFNPTTRSGYWIDGKHCPAHSSGPNLTENQIQQFDSTLAFHTGIAAVFRGVMLDRFAGKLPPERTDQEEFNHRLDLLIKRAEEKLAKAKHLIGQIKQRNAQESENVRTSS